MFLAAAQTTNEFSTRKTEHVPLNRFGQIRFPRQYPFPELFDQPPRKVRDCLQPFRGVFSSSARTVHALHSDWILGRLGKRQIILRGGDLWGDQPTISPRLGLRNCRNSIQGCKSRQQLEKAKQDYKQALETLRPKLETALSQSPPKSLEPR